MGVVLAQQGPHHGEDPAVPVVSAPPGARRRRALAESSPVGRWVSGSGPVPERRPARSPEDIVAVVPYRFIARVEQQPRGELRVLLKLAQRDLKHDIKFVARIIEGRVERDFAAQLRHFSHTGLYSDLLAQRVRVWTIFADFRRLESMLNRCPLETIVFEFARKIFAQIR